MLTWTNQPYESAWNHLRLLTHKANVKKLLAGSLQSGRTFYLPEGELLERKSAQIAFSINQAYEYFQAGDRVSEHTSPLLYFYGMLGLCKAVIVANDPNLLLDDIKYHGLHSRPITPELQTYSQSASDWCIEREYAVTHEGVFRRLTEVVQGFSFPRDTVFTFQQLLAVEPEVAELYSKYYGQHPHVFNLYSYSKKGEHPFMIYPSTTDRDEFVAAFPYIENHFEILPEIYHSQALILRSKSELPHLPDSLGIYRLNAGGEYLIGSLPKIQSNGDSSANGGEFHYLLPEMGDYVRMFILSNCVRYKPEFWGQSVQGEYGRSLGLASLAVSTARARHPQFILNQLFNEKFEYASAGWWA